MVSPWLLRTIHRKGSQADEYFGYGVLQFLRRLYNRIDLAALSFGDVLRAEFVHNINRARHRDQYRNDERAAHDVEEESEGEDDDHEVNDDYANAARTMPQRSPRQTSPRSQRQKLYPDEQHAPSQPGRNRKAFYDAQGNALVGPSNGLHQAHDVSVAVDATEYYQPPQQRAIDTAPAYADHSAPHNIPYASPVFVMDPHARLEPPEFWQLWKQTETTYVGLL